MKYTTSKKADKKVEQDLKIIKKIIIKEINPTSIILFGGFGRGEGTFEIVNGKILPLNDYDLYVVTKKQVPDKKLEQVGIECSKAIGRGGLEFVENYLDTYDKNKFFHVDLRCLKYSQISKLKRINRTYELKHGSTLIYGEDVRKKIRDISLPTTEAFRYLINPACHLLLCMDSARLKGKFKKDEKLYAMHHIIKTYLACASSLIISVGKFSESYKGTNKEFQKLYSKKFPELAKRIDEATRLKLYPKHTKIQDIKKRWFQARDDLTFVLNHISLKHLNIRAKNIKELTKKLYKKLPYFYFTPHLPFGFLSRFAFPAQYALNILYFKRTHHIRALFTWRDVGLRIAMAAFLLLHALDDPSLTEEAYKYTKTFHKPKSKKWDDLRISLLYGFDRYFSQKLI